MIPSMGGALSGIKVIEIGALGAAPFAAMMLADHGADVLRVERPGAAPVVANKHDELAAWDLLSRGRLSAGVDLKHPDGVALIRRLAADADVMIEGFRPGVAERLGIGPDELCAANERLVYGRLTGWGRTGPLADRAGHDINYISVAGVQAHIGRVDQPPTPPLNLVGDFGGGGMLLAFGICAALVERSISGVGQVVDAAMIDGAALLMAPLLGAASSGYWSDEPGTNLLDSGAPFYDCYECADGRWMSVGALEAAFYARMLEGLGLSAREDLPDQHDSDRWPELRAVIGDAFRSRSRDEWTEIFTPLDACVAPVLTMSEAPTHPQTQAWGTFVEVAGVTQPVPAPRFSRTVPDTPSVAQIGGANTDEVLAQWGITAVEIDRLRAAGAIN